MRRLSNSAVLIVTHTPSFKGDEAHQYYFHFSTILTPTLPALKLLSRALRVDYGVDFALDLDYCCVTLSNALLLPRHLLLSGPRIQYQCAESLKFRHVAPVTPDATPMCHRCFFVQRAGW